MEKTVLKNLKNLAR